MTGFSEALGEHSGRVQKALDEITAENVLARIWEHDHRVWKPDPTEITNRLGWLHSPQEMSRSIAGIKSLAADLKTAGYSQALLLGMGGSSLAPEVFMRTFRTDGLALQVLDSTDPGAVLDHEQSLDLAKTVFIVATKSGGTVETLSFFKYFYGRIADSLGKPKAGEHFIAITDPGSSLENLAQELAFRTVYLNDPNIGGRYSVLSYFGLVPAGLMGIDLQRFLDRAVQTRSDCGSSVPPADNPGARLGAIIGELALAGRNKLTLVLSDEIQSFGDWAEQLIAESTGKEGKGILPVVGEALGDADIYRDDRLFVAISAEGDQSHQAALTDLEAAGHPVVRLTIKDEYDLGGQFFLWQLATAVAGHRMGINPFDQPNVEAAKVLARQMVAEFMQKGDLPFEEPAFEHQGLAVHHDASLKLPLQEPGAALEAFLNRGMAGSYVAIHSYLQPSPALWDTLQDLRMLIRNRTKLATTLGYGPRFLHSTGQLHKGDEGKGLFIQLTADDAIDVDIPDEAGVKGSKLSFGILKATQAAGDRQALLDSGRDVIRFHLGEDAFSGLNLLKQHLDQLSAD